MLVHVVKARIKNANKFIAIFTSVVLYAVATVKGPTSLIARGAKAFSCMFTKTNWLSQAGSEIKKRNQHKLTLFDLPLVNFQWALLVFPVINWLIRLSKPEQHFPLMCPLSV